MEAGTAAAAATQGTGSKTMADAREGETHFLAAGHWASETFGVRRVGALLEERFGVEHEFVRVPNPV